jgi:hypothetical protein
MKAGFGLRLLLAFVFVVRLAVVFRRAGAALRVVFLFGAAFLRAVVFRAVVFRFVVVLRVVALRAVDFFFAAVFLAGFLFTGMHASRL